MKKKSVKKTIMAALLSLSVLCTTAFAFPASAATESVNGCEHKNQRVISSVFLGYSNANPSTHQVTYENTYMCEDCKQVLLPAKKESYSEPHKQKPGTVYCICGYYLH